MLSFLLITLAAQADPALPTTVFLVRHAEKATGEAPPLTKAGLARAANLGKVFTDASVDAVFTTDLCRTAQTADPVARIHALPLQVLPLTGTDLATCVPALTQPIQPLPKTDDVTADLVARVRGMPAGSTVFVAGHSNTVPGLVEALGAPSLCPAVLALDEEGRCWLGHDDYDDLFVVTIPGEGAPGALRLTIP